MKKDNQKKPGLILFIDEGLRFFLSKALRRSEFLEYSMGGRRTTIKDVLESTGIPHTEAGSILHNGRQLDFGFHPLPGQHFRIKAIEPPLDVFSPSILRPDPLTEIKFIVDVNTGRLAGLLRMAGFDTAYDPDLKDPGIAEKACMEKRILLTRDTGLLKRKNLNFARFIRSIHPGEQLREVIHFFNLASFVSPLTRCSVCNGILKDVEKSEIIHRLEPRTKEYYEDFRICLSCERIYWEGSHTSRIMDLIKKSTA